MLLAIPSLILLDSLGNFTSPVHVIGESSIEIDWQQQVFTGEKRFYTPTSIVTFCITHFLYPSS